MPVESAVRRFYDHPDLLSDTLEYLERSEIVRLSPALLPQVATVLYRQIDVPRYREINQLLSVCQAMERDLPRRARKRYRVSYTEVYHDAMCPLMTLPSSLAIQ